MRDFLTLTELFLASLNSNVELRSYNEVIRDVCGRNAMSEEIRALERNGTWTVEMLLKGKQPLAASESSRSNIE